ncbi:hypothetical protein PanWU01x14_308800, partial [Parasponia andersonii]
MQIFPEKVRELWNEWELRALVLTSLVLQIILILIGNWRKHSTRNIVRIILWLAYLSADSVATVSLGVLSNNQEDNSKSGNDSPDPDYVITAFWAPFLLLHLGGPDTITAYSLEDNELWLRHLLGLVVQVGVAFYVFLRAWDSNTLNFLSIPMFIAGIIKFGERTWALRSASSEHFRESMLPPPDPGPNYATYMDEYNVKKEEGFLIISSTVINEAYEAGESPPRIVGNTNSRTGAGERPPRLVGNTNSSTEAGERPPRIVRSTNSSTEIVHEAEESSEIARNSTNSSTEIVHEAGESSEIARNSNNSSTEIVHEAGESSETARNTNSSTEIVHDAGETSEIARNNNCSTEIVHEARQSPPDVHEAGQNSREIVSSTNAGTETVHEAGEGPKNERNTIAREEIVRRAHDFFQTFRRLCADLILSYRDITKSRSFFKRKSLTSDEAFKVIEVELGFIYDVFYTKAVFIHTRTGAVLRGISFSSIVLVLFAFMFTDKEAYSGVDVTISYILLVGAMIIEIFAVIVLLLSDWAMLWLSKHKKTMAAADRFKFNWGWSNKLSQYNLLSVCLKEEPPRCIALQKIFCIDKLVDKYCNRDRKDVLPELKKLIFEQLEKNSGGERDDFRGCKEFCHKRGDQVLKKEKLEDVFGWTVEVEFDQSLLLWHIATDLCYYTENPPTSEAGKTNHTVSKLLSDYMMYLAVDCPFMLPNGIVQIRFQDTCSEVSEFFDERGHKKDPKEAREMLMKVNTDVPPSEVKGDRSKSVLFEACVLAKDLKTYLPEIERRWDVISRVWVEILSYAANQCRWSHHGQQLRRGGELLTHVWLLMAHL